jgi:FAR1 DNA-binding domain
LFWRIYGGKKVFGVRKNYDSKSKKDGIITLKVFFLLQRRYMRKNKRDHLTKNSHTETRTNCHVLLQMKFDRGSQKYKVTDFISEHNRPLQKSQNFGFGLFE